MDIYFDTCALNRLTDDQSQARVRAEAEAVDSILGVVASGELRWLASAALRYELRQNPDSIKRAEALGLLLYVHSDLALTPAVEERARQLHGSGLGEYDALHLALCETGTVDVLLTVDDRFLHRTSTLPGTPRLEIVNPVDWWARRRTWLRSP